MLHRDLVVSDGIHVIHSWIVADSAALAALTLLPIDIGKVAYQVDIKRFLVLENDVGPVWGTTHSPSNTDELPEAITNLYFTADRVLSAVLTGLSTAAGTVVNATHTILQAIGFLQKQITDNGTSIVSNTTAISSNTASIGSNTSTLSSHSTAIAANAAAIAAKVGVPASGITGQVLAKNSNADGDLAWITIPPPPSPKDAFAVVITSPVNQINSTDKIDFVMPLAFTLTKVKASLTVANGAGATQVFVKVAGVSIIKDAAGSVDSYINIAAGADYGEIVVASTVDAFSFTTTNIAENAKVSIGVQGTPDATARALKVYLVGNWT